MFVLKVDVHLFFILVELSGYLAAPGDFEAIAQQRKIHLTWTPPFSLGRVPIGGYFLAIFDITDDVNVSTVETIRLNYTEKETNLTTDRLLTCRSYQFTILAFNEVGNGNLSDKRNASFQNGKCCV